MARLVITSSLPLRTATSHAVGRQVVVPTPEHVRRFSLGAITPSQLPGSPLPGEEAFNRALNAAARHLQLQDTPSTLRSTVAELLTRAPEDRRRMCAESPPLAALWNTFMAELPPVASVEPSRPEPLLVVGFATLSDLELQTLNVAASDGSVIILPPREMQAVDDLVTGLERLGWIVHEESPPDSPDVGERLATRFVTGQDTAMTEVTIEAAADLHQECAAALTALGALSGEVLLVVPDLALYAPELEAVAFDLGVTLDLQLERPLAATRLGAWLAELFGVLGGDWSGPGVRRVLGHPLARDVTPALLQAVSRTRAGKREAWVALGLPEWLRQWPEGATYEQFAELTYTVLGGLDAQRLRQDDHRAGQQLLDELDHLATQTEVVSLHDFARQAARLLQESLPPLPGTGWPVRTPITAVGRFDHVAILGLSEGLLPAPPVNPPLLDFYDRQLLHREGVRCLTALDAVRTRDLAFWNALGTARQSLRLSWPQRLGKRQQQPGDYLARLAPAASGPTQTGQEKQPAAWAVNVPAPLTDETGHTGQSFPLDQHTFSATQLTRFSQCPYRWYGQHALGLHEHEEGSVHLLPHERGRFNHRVLELVGRRAKDHPQPRDVILSHFPAAFEQAETEQGFIHRSTWPQQRPELRRRLHQALQSPEFIREGAIVVEVERAFDVRWNGLRVTGKIDRADAVNGELFITDYKSGSSLQTGSRDSRDVQMNLYLDVASALYPGLHIVTGQYLSLGNVDRRVLGQIHHRPGALDQLVNELKAAAGAGFFPAKPGHHCDTCPLPSLCRRSEQAGDDA